MIPLNSFAQEINQSESVGKIVFTQHDGNYWQIWIMDLDGSNKKKLTSSSVDKCSPDFSSDGNKIAYVTNEGKLMTMDSSGDNKTHIPLNISAREPKWCFEDEKIIFTSYRGVFFLDDSDIWIVDSDGSGLNKIIRRPSLQFLPNVSEDNKEMLFVDVLEISSHEIFKLNLETGDYLQLTDNSYHDTDPVFVADTNKVETRDGQPQETAKNTTTGQIVYACDKDANYDIWIMDKFGQNPKNLTGHPAYDSSPAITKDGKAIFFLSDRKKTMQIWSMDIDGGNLKQITKDKYDKQDITISE